MILFCCASELGLHEDLSAIEVILYYYLLVAARMESDVRSDRSHPCKREYERRNRALHNVEHIYQVAQFHNHFVSSNWLKLFN